MCSCLGIKERFWLKIMMGMSRKYKRCRKPLNGPCTYMPPSSCFAFFTSRQSHNLRAILGKEFVYSSVHPLINFVLFHFTRAADRTEVEFGQIQCQYNSTAQTRDLSRITIYFHSFLWPYYLANNENNIKISFFWYKCPVTQPVDQRMEEVGVTLLARAGEMFLECDLDLYIAHQYWTHLSSWPAHIP